MAMFNLIRLTTFSVGTVARMVFTVTCTIVFGGALLNSNYYTLSHYAPEFEESKSEWLEHTQAEYLHGGANPLEHEHDYYMLTGGKGAFSRLLNLRVFAGFIAAIELLRVRVRAVSLSLRLIANLSCGHILLTLYSSNLVSRFDADISKVWILDIENLLSFSMIMTIHLVILVLACFSIVAAVEGVGEELLIFALLLVRIVAYGLPGLLLVCGLLLRTLETVVAIVQAYVFLTLATSYLQ